MIVKKGRVNIEEIQDIFSLSKETTMEIIDFLVKFSFIQFDKSRRYVTLSKACKKFFAEEDL